MTASVDTVIGLVAAVLLVMSVWSWAVIINKSMQLRPLRRAGRALANAFWAAGATPDALARLSQDDRSGVFASIALAVHQPQEATEEQTTRALRGALLDARTQLESGLTGLASIGSAAPFVGLFGTVWSIFNALVAIDGQGPVMIDQVAGPVGEALVITAAGLFVAIPAVMAYNALARSARLVLAELDGFAHDLQASAALTRAS